MAKAIGGWLSTNYYADRCLRLDWEATQDIVKNQSTIKWTLKCDGQAQGYVKAGAFKVKIDGVEVYSSSTRIELYIGTVVATGSNTISHNSDGSRSFSVSIEGAIYTYAVNCTGSYKWELVDIPRAATITSAPNFTDEHNPIIFYSNPAGNNVEKLEVCIADNNGKVIIVPYREIAKTNSVYAFYFTDEEREALRAAVISGYTLPVRFYLKTTIGGTVYYKSVAKTLSLENYEPTISYFEVADENQNARDLTQTDGSVLIKGFNNVYCYFGGTGAKGATITSYKLTNGSTVINSSDGYFDNTENGVFTATVTDSRGNSSSTTIELPVIDYFKPTISQKVEIALEGETAATVNLDLSGKCFHNYFDTETTQGEPNELKLFVRHTQNDGSMGSWVELTDGLVPTFNGNEYSLTATISGLQYNRAYTFQCAAQDSVSEMITTPEYTVQLTPVYYWNGKSFNLNVPLTIKGNTLTDYIVEQGEEAMGSNGTWHWEKWASGKAVCYGKRNYGNMAVTTAWGSVYQSTQFAQDLPSDLFIAAPEYLDIKIVNTSAMGSVAQGTNGGATKDSTGNFLIWRPTSMNLTAVNLGFYAIGRWK